MGNKKGKIIILNNFKVFKNVLKNFREKNGYRIFKVYN